MLLYEVPSSSVIELTAYIGTQKLVFSTEATIGFDKKTHRLLAKTSKGLPYLITKPIQKDGTLVSFPSENVVYQLISIDPVTKQPTRWFPITVKQIRLPDNTTWHMFISDKEGKPCNRRERYRLFLGFTGVAQIGLAKSMFQVQIRDISSTGISFIVEKSALEDKGCEPQLRSLATLAFDDKNSGLKFRLVSIIVRKQEIKGGRILFGCKFPEESQNVSRYINSQQLKRLQERNS